MAIKTFTAGSILTASDTNTYLANSGLVYLSTTSFSGATNKTFTNIFTSEYTNYRALIRVKGAGTSASYIRFMVGNTIQTDNLFSISYGVRYSAGAMGIGTRGDQYSLFGGVAATYFSNYAIEFYSPQVTSYTNFTVNGVFQYLANDHDTVNIFTRNAVTTSINGFELTTAGGTNIDGEMVLYGYRKA